MECSPLDGMTAASVSLMKHNTMAAHLINTPETIICSFDHQYTIAAVCTIHRIHCKNISRLLRQYLPNLHHQPARTERAEKAWDHHLLEVSRQATHHPTALNLIVGVPTPQGLQWFKKEAHQQLKGNLAWAFNCWLSL